MPSTEESVLFCSAPSCQAKMEMKGDVETNKKKSSMLALFISNLRLWHENISKMNKLSSVRGARSKWRLCKNIPRVNAENKIHGKRL